MTMYLDHFGLREAPFKITPHTEFFFAGANRGETLEALIYAITSGEGIVKVTGEVGAGKTMLCRVLIDRLPKSVETIYFAVPSLSPDELLATIASDLGVETDGINITKLIRALQTRLIEIYGSGRRVVALIDEAHAMPVETLDQIRLLSNLETSHEKLMQIVLFGQPELDQHLSMPNIRQLKERITHSFNLLPLPARDIKDYLNFRLRAAGYHGPDLFGADALKLITEASEGLTRRINIYADKTLLAAFASGTHNITADHVRAAIADTQITLPGAKSERKRIGLVIAVTLLIGAALGFVGGQILIPAISTPTVTAPTTPIIKVIEKATEKVAEKATETPPPNQGITRTADKVVATDAPLTSVSPSLPVGTSTSAGSNPVKPEATIPVPTIPPNPSDSTVTSRPVAAPRVPSVAQVAQVAKVVVDIASTPDWLGKRMTADAARVAALSKKRYAVQLMSADQRQQAAIEAYLRTVYRELNPDLILIFPTGSAGTPRVAVLYGNFDGPAEASAELAGLPVPIAKFRPYIRSFGAISNDLRPETP